MPIEGPKRVYNPKLSAIAANAAARPRPVLSQMPVALRERILSLAKPLLSHSDPLVVRKAAEAIGKLGEIDTALIALKPFLSNSDPWVVRTAAEAIGQLGDKRGLDLLESSNLEQLDLAYALFEFIDAYKTKPEFQMTHEPHPAVKLAAYIRAVCNQHDRVRENKAVQGYQNRGMFKGKRPESDGFDFQEYRELLPGQAGKVDQQMYAKTGKTYERIYAQTQSHNSMIVVNPGVFTETDKENIQLLLGTLAELQAKRKNPVGLLIGDGRNGAYLPPTRKSALENILARVMSYSSGGQTPTTLAILEQDLLRKNLPAGSRVYLAANFLDENDLGKLAQAIEAYRARGIYIIPVQVGNTLTLPDQTVRIGRHLFAVNRALAKLIAKYTAGETNAALRNFLNKYRGLCVPAGDQAEKETMPLQVISEFNHPAGKISVGGNIRWQGEEIIEIPETQPPPNLPQLIEKSVKANKLEALVNIAKVKGWSMVFDWIEAKKRELIFGGIKYEPSPVEGPLSLATMTEEELGNDQNHLWVFTALCQGAFDNTSVMSGENLTLEEKVASFRRGPFVNRNRSEFENHQLEAKIISNSEAWQKIWGTYAGPWNAATWGYSRKNLTAFRQDLAKVEGRSSRRAIKKSQGPVIAKSMEVSPLTSSVGKEESAKSKIWLRLDQPLTGSDRYMATGIFGDFDPSRGSYGVVPGLSLETFQAGNGEKVSGVIARSAKVKNVPIPLGGKLLEQKERKVQFELAAPPPPSKIMALSLSEFKKQAVGLYGEKYAALTQTVPLEFIPEDAQALLKSLSRVSVKDAIVAIQAFVIKNFEYRKYTGEVEKTLFENLKRRAEAGELEGPNEYLKLILDLQAGQCAELSEVTLALLRLAGIPAAKCRCYLADGDQVDEEAHSVAIAIFPAEPDGWQAEPVETSVSQVSETIKQEAKTVLAEVVEGVRDVTVQKEAEASSDTFQGMRTAWANASETERKRISKDWEYLLHVVMGRTLTISNAPLPELMLTPAQYRKFTPSRVEPPWYWLESIRQAGASLEELRRFVEIWSGTSDQSL